MLYDYNILYIKKKKQKLASLADLDSQNAALFPDLFAEDLGHHRLYCT